MIKKTITYTDFNGNERTETFRFHLSKAELAEMELSAEGGLAETLRRIIDANDSKQLVAIFKDLILRSYGELSPDGRRFVKNDELRNEFKDTQAYSDLFMELATDDKAAVEFVNGIVPAEISEAKDNVVELPTNA